MISGKLNSSILTRAQIFLREIAFNGLSYVTPQTITEIDTLFRDSAENKFDRLSASLRYLRVEMDRYLRNKEAFSIDRYSFFLGNTWILSKGLVKATSTDNFGTKDNGALPSIPLSIPEAKFRVIGIERVEIQGSMSGYVLHMLGLAEPISGRTIRWNFLSSAQVLPSFAIALSNLGIELHPLHFYKHVLRLKDVSLSPDGSLIVKKMLEIDAVPEALNKIDTKPQDAGEVDEGVGKKPQTPRGSKSKQEKTPSTEESNAKNPISQKISSKKIDEKAELPPDPIPPVFLNSFNLDAATLLRHIDEYHVTPLDNAATFSEYVLLHNLHVLKWEKKEGERFATPFYEGSLTSSDKITVQLKFDEKRVHQPLITFFERNAKSGIDIDGIFGRLSINDGELWLFPLSYISKGDLNFFGIADDVSKDLQDYLKKLYEKT